MSEDTSRSCETRLLSDLPAESDAFGSHRRVAEALRDLVSSEQGGRAIALTGWWGSGKSTVVALLDRLLKVDSSEGRSGSPTAVFVFDAWAHRGDPLRRSFLEELSDCLTRKGWVNKGRWQEDLDTIRRRLDQSETRSEPILTIPGRLLAMSALLVPVGNILLGKFDSPTNVVRQVSNGALGLLLAFAPLLVAAGTWVFWRPTWRVWRSDFWLRHRAHHEKESVFSLFIQTTRHVTRNTTVRTPDPTSLEFGELFGRMLSVVLNDQGRRLILVIDNLDRIDVNDAISIWSTMRTFLEFDYNASPWLKQLWLLVPIDESAMMRLWKSADGTAGELATAFVQKTFQVSFRVSPPVLSDWSAFFRSQLAEAFPTHQPAEDFDTVYRLFRIKGLAKDRPPTPREIKLFINQVGSLHRQWLHEIPLPVQAAYVLHLSDIKDISRDLTRDDFLDRRVGNLIGELPWQNYFAALHFNVEPQKALQTLIGQRIEEAVTKGQRQELEELAVVPGFRHLCEQIIEEQYQEWAEKEPATLATVAAAVSGLSSLTEEAGGRLWEWLRKGVERVTTWKTLDAAAGQGIAAVLEHCGKADHRRVAETVLTSIVRTTPEASGDAAPDRRAAGAWLAAVSPVLLSLHRAGCDDILRQTFRVPGEAHFYVYLIQIWAESRTDEEILPYLVPQGEPRAVVERLASDCGQERFDEWYPEAIEVMVGIGTDWPWQLLAEALVERLQATNALQAEETEACVESLLRMATRECEQAPEAILALSNDGTLMHHLNQVRKHPRGAALCVLATMEFNPTGTLANQPGSAASGLEYYQGILASPEKQSKVVEELSNLVDNFGKIPNLLKASESAIQVRPLLAAVLQRVALPKEGRTALTPALLIEYFPLLRDSLGVEVLRDVTKQLVEQSDLCAVIAQDGFVETRAELCVFVVKVIAEVLPPPFVEYLRNGLQSLPKEVWLTELNEEGHALELGIGLLERGVSLNLSQGFEDGLIEHAEQLLDGASGPEQFKEQWPRTLDALDVDSRLTFLRNVRDLMLKHEEKPMHPLMDLYGAAISDTDRVLEEKADDVVRHLFKGIVERKVPSELAWLSNVLAPKSAVWKAADEASRRAFEKRVEALLSEELETDSTSILAQIAKAIGVVVPEPSKEEEAKPDNDGEGPS